MIFQILEEFERLLLSLDEHQFKKYEVLFGNVCKLRRGRQKVGEAGGGAGQIISQFCLRVLDF